VSRVLLSHRIVYKQWTSSKKILKLLRNFKTGRFLEEEEKKVLCFFAA